MTPWQHGVAGWRGGDRSKENAVVGGEAVGVGKGGAEKCFALNVIDVQVSGLSLKAVMLAVTTQ